MPELPEVETLVRGLRPDVTGRMITGFESTWPRQIAGMDSLAFADRIYGQRVERLWRRAKYLVFDLSSDVLLVHLKMSGRLYVTPQGQPRPDDRWVRAIFLFDDGSDLRFSDLRKFGRLYLVGNMESITAQIGPEPLDESFTPALFAAALTGRARSIKPLLMDQSVIAGVGNIYADEALWRAQIDPRRAANTLSSMDVERLYHAVRGALNDGIDHEGSSINWYRKADGGTGEHQNHFNAYGQQGRPCGRCGGPIHKIWLGQRGTHFCPVCQV